MPDYGHSLEFGSFLTPQAREPHAPVRLAVLAEDAGLDLVTFQDHPYQSAFLDTWTLMTWVAAQTTRVRISANVLNVPLRPPAVLARAGASLDLLSGGRFAMALGAGAYWDAIAAMGGPRRTGPEAFTALDEAITVMRGLWNTDERGILRFHGQFYSLDGAKRGPDVGHTIPLWVGALGPKMLTLIGRRADGWLPTLARLAPGGLARSNMLVDDAARAAGRNPTDIRRLANIAWLGSGDIPAWAATLTRLALDEGIGTFILADDDPHHIETFAQVVAPEVRDAVAQARHEVAAS